MCGVYDEGLSFSGSKPRFYWTFEVLFLLKIQSLGWDLRSGIFLKGKAELGCCAGDADRWKRGGSEAAFCEFAPGKAAVCGRDCDYICRAAQKPGETLWLLCRRGAATTSLRAHAVWQP